MVTNPHAARTKWTFAPHPPADGPDEVASPELDDAINRSSVAAHTYPPDVVLLRQGYPLEQVYFIEDGLVKLNRVEPGGQQTIVGLRSSGSVLGTSAATLESDSQVTATTLTRCNIRHISTKVFRHLLKTDVQFSWSIQYSQSRESDEHIARIAQLSCHSARQRLEHLLWNLSTKLASDKSERFVKIEVPLRQWEIAQLIDVCPEHLCRMFKQLKDTGVTTRKKGWLIVDTEKLWRASGSQNLSFEGARQRAV
jgi:CRP-like cAMP-binding protein